MALFSKKDSTTPNLNLFYRLPFIIACFAIFWNSFLPSLLDELIFPYSDNFFHAAAYAIIALLIARDLKEEKSLWYMWQIKVASIAFATFYGIFDKIYQFFVPSRICSIWDIAADGVGSLLFSIIYLDIRVKKK
jgi:hypothetical protein